MDPKNPEFTHTFGEDGEPIVFASHRHLDEVCFEMVIFYFFNG